MATEKRKKRVYVYIIDDHPAFRAGLNAILSATDHLVVTGEAGHCKQARQQMRLIRVDLLILDVSLPGESGLAFIEEARRIKPDLKVILLTMHSDWTYLQKAIEARADAYLLKDAADFEILSCVDAVLEGRKIFPGLAGKMEDRRPTDSLDLTALSLRELEILRWIGRGYSNREIAQELGIAKKTVESHRFHIVDKLQLKGASELLRVALATAGQIKVPDERSASF